MKTYKEFVKEAKADLVMATARIAKKAINPKNIALAKSFVRNQRGGYLDKVGRSLGQNLKNFAQVYKPTHKLALVDDPATLYRRVHHMSRRGQSFKKNIQPASVVQGNALKDLKDIATRMKSPNQNTADYARRQFVDRKLNVINKRLIRRGKNYFKNIDDTGLA